MTTARLDVPRLIRIVALALTLAATALVYLSYAPQIDALNARIDAGRDEVRSDEVAFSQATALRAERARFASRYANLFAQDSEAVFVRELATIVRRHHVELASTTASQDDDPKASGADDLPFVETKITVEMRGSYRALLATIADLSTGSEIVDVREPSLHRDGNEIVASVPAVIYEPVRSPQAPSPHAGTRR